jgi:hypothetical protein
VKKKIISFLILATYFNTCACSPGNQNSVAQNNTFEFSDAQQDIDEIQKLIHQVLSWSDSTESIVIYPVKQEGSSLYFDQAKLRENLDKLRGTGFFSTEFIEDYSRIILTLHEKLRNKEYKKWMEGDLPPFKFGSNISPWCMCQGFSLAQFSHLETIQMNSKSGELIWKWKEGNSWIDFRFRVVKENDKWKISYMQGFDYEEGIKRDGQS